jgi:hypothetical protein
VVDGNVLAGLGPAAVVRALDAAVAVEDVGGQDALVGADDSFHGMVSWMGCFVVF